MKLPTSLNINGVEYRITVTDIIDDAFAGGCHAESGVIMISSKQSKHEAIATLLHECLHAIESEYKVKIGEQRIRKLEYALAEVFLQLTARKK